MKYHHRSHMRRIQDKYNLDFDTLKTLEKKCWHYNYDVESIVKIWCEQNGICAICTDKKNLELDHDHETTNARGFLCQRCNMALGHIERYMDKIDLIKNYLEKGKVYTETMWAAGRNGKRGLVKDTSLPALQKRMAG